MEHIPIAGWIVIAFIAVLAFVLLMLQGLKLLRLNITVPPCERHFYFVGMFTETVQ